MQDYQDAAHHGRQYAEIIDHLDGIIWEADARTFAITFVSQQAERLLGYPLERWTNEPTFWQDHLHPEDREATIRYCLDCTMRGEGHDFEYRMLAADGRTVWLRDIVTVEMHAGAPIALRGVMVDITEHKRVEAAHALGQARLRVILESVPVCVKLIAADGTLLEMNRAGLAMIEAESVEQVVERGMLSLVLPEYRQPFSELLARVLAGESGRLSFEMVGLGGKRRWMESQFIPLRDGEGQVTALGVTRDVTETRAAAEKLALQQTELLHVSRLSTMGQMAAALSHEISQPLSSVSNFATACGLFLRAGEPVNLAEIEQGVDEIARQSLRAGAILKRMRDFVRKSGPTRAPCDLNAVLRDSVELVQFELGRRETRVEWRLAKSLPEVSADRIQLQQVVVNLLTNASEAMLAVPPERRVVSLSSHQSGGRIEIEISDRGPGIPGELQERIFEPFVSGKPDGLGLGLNICRTIMHEHGGSIELVKLQKEGVCFRLILPLGGSRHA